MFNDTSVFINSVRCLLMLLECYKITLTPFDTLQCSYTCTCNSANIMLQN